MNLSEKIADIRNEFARVSLSHISVRDCMHEWERLIGIFAGDERSGVQKLVRMYQNKIAALKNELARLETIRMFENKYGNEYSWICGVDEAGRGPLAGPVVAGAVILPKDCEILYVNDSKKLSTKRREELFEEIREKAVSYGIGMSSAARIDEINILQATYEAMTFAVQDLTVVPELLLNDAVTIPQLKIRQIGIIGGDGKSMSIAAASIMAKVTRDRLMVQYAQEYPEYGFEKHKGYGSAAHIEALKTYGPCPIHRASFIKNFVKEGGDGQ